MKISQFQNELSVFYHILRKNEIRFQKIIWKDKREFTTSSVRRKPDTFPKGEGIGNLIFCYEFCKIFHLKAKIFKSLPLWGRCRRMRRKRLRKQSFTCGKTKRRFRKQSKTRRKFWKAKRYPFLKQENCRTARPGFRRRQSAQSEEN